MDRTTLSISIPSAPTGSSASPTPRPALLKSVVDPFTRRAWRVGALVALIATLSAWDLTLTLTFLKNGGMSEGNPIARWIMSYNCQWVLIAFKFSLVTITCGIFLALRTRATAELGAWAGVLLLSWLMIQWGHYATYADELADAFVHSPMVIPELAQEGNWVRIDP